jgi:hypothetical protein
MGYRFSLCLSPVDTQGAVWKTGDEIEFGETDIYEHKIHFNPKQSAVQMHSTRLHEYIHAILQVSGVNELLDEKSEEAVVKAIEHGLAPLIKFK